jgi:hypothetical protein
MIELSDLFRTREDTLEIFATGLSHKFTDANQDALFDSVGRRIKFMGDQILSYCTENQIILSDYNVVLDCRMENFYMAGLGKKVAEYLNLSTERTQILTSVDPKRTVYPYSYELDLLADIDSCYFYTELLAENIDWISVELDKPVMSLAGRPSEYRAGFTKRLVDLCGNKVRASLGNVSQTPLTGKQLDTLRSLMHPYSFPFSQGTDGKILGSILYQHGVPGYQMFGSLLHLVNETNDFSNTNVQLSEKSFKVFAWHQIPIFMASPKQVETIRNIGFDMFDDIIDHSYDFAPNLDLHDTKVLNIVAKFLKAYPTIEAVNELRKKLYPRLKANNDLLYSLYKNRKYEPWPHYS